MNKVKTHTKKLYDIERRIEIMSKPKEVNFNLEDLIETYPEQVWIELQPEFLKEAWQKIEDYSNPASRWNAYLNQITLHHFVSWVKADSDITDSLEVWLSEANLPSFWEIVNGTKLILGETQLILIPTDTSNASEFRIPQEWVDIPNWLAHYYLAVQINLDQNWMRIYGYISYEKIREQGKYDPIDQTYRLDSEDLVEDLNTMWVARDLFPAQPLEAKQLPTLSSKLMEINLEQLSQQTDYSPRLVLKFEEWAALIADDQSRQKLYQKRLFNQKNKFDIDNNYMVLSDQPPRINHNKIKVNDLNRWFQNIFEAGWQSVDTLLRREQKTLAYQFRTDSTFNDFPIKTAKLIDLGMELQGIAVILLIGLTVEVDKKVGIRVQLHPSEGETYLPPNLKLSLLSDLGVMLQEVQSRSHDNYIQLKRFKSPAGKGFSIQLSLGNANIKEDFVFY